jgi:hypothetical protein
MLLLMTAFASGGLAADQTPARFPVVFELRHAGEMSKWDSVFFLQTEDTLYKGGAADWLGNSVYSGIAEDGKVRFEDVKRGQYLLIHARKFMGMSTAVAPVGKFDLNKEVTIPVDLPRMRICKISLSLPPRGKAEPDTSVEVVVESHAGRALGYMNVIYLHQIGDHLEGEWDDLPELGGTFQLKFAARHFRNPWVGIGLADITVTPKMVASGVIQLRYSAKKSPPKGNPKK